MLRSSSKISTVWVDSTSGMFWKEFSTSSLSAAMSRVRTSSTMSLSPDTSAACSTSATASNLVRNSFQAA